MAQRELSQLCNYPRQILLVSKIVLLHMVIEGQRLTELRGAQNQKEGKKSSKRELISIPNHSHGHELIHCQFFVAQPNCQQLLATLWYDGFPGWRRKHWVVKLLTCMTIGFLFPMLSIAYLISPRSNLGLFIKKPFIKFICHTASYLTFLFMLLLASQHIVRTDLHVQGPPPTVVEWMILPWVLGFIWGEIKEMWDGGFTEYIHDWWNLMDFAMNSLYLATISLKIVAYVKYNGSRPREEWEMWHPTLIAEALFAISNILSSLRLISLFTANSHLGPLQISLGRMLLDILKFLFIYCLVLLAFANGLNQLYFYYETRAIDEPNNCKGIRCEKQNNAFSTLFETLQSLFWSVFGLLNLYVTNVKARHEFTEFVGATMFGTYNVISLVVLLNMLIAMMNNSYQLIARSLVGYCPWGRKRVRYDLATKQQHQWTPRLFPYLGYKRHIESQAKKVTEDKSLLLQKVAWGFPSCPAVKNPPTNTGDMGSIPEQVHSTCFTEPHLLWISYLPWSGSAWRLR
ncbi:hypothetical protein FD755_023395 [Muntiacus reevesi]|uniref:Ion transport domain-containing protein n=1 Tax=Muntiacus reevesi TaxID=9886 RepID=A0A5N3VXW9_MUNRE|nr:hypothetical protein FD755_023395 [Muntiacus reevesi]